MWHSGEVAAFLYLAGMIALIGLGAFYQNKGKTNGDKKTETMGIILLTIGLVGLVPLGYPG